jgi:hypothetical protein
MAIPLQTIKILGRLVLGEHDAFDRHAQSFYTKATAGITRRSPRRMVLACVPNSILRRHGVLIGAYRGRPRARQREIDLVERTALPAQREVGCSLVAFDL